MKNADTIVSRLTTLMDSVCASGGSRLRPNIHSAMNVDSAKNASSPVKLQEEFLVDLEDAAIIKRDQKGRLHVTTPAHHAVTWGTLSGLFWGMLIGLIFLWPLAPVVGVAGGIMGAALGAAGDLGIKDEFRQRVHDMLQPGTSAIMVIVRKVTPDKFIETLKPYGGTVLKTSLPYDAEQQLMKALHGDDPSAPTWQQPASAGATT